MDPITQNPRIPVDIHLRMVKLTNSQQNDQKKDGLVLNGLEKLLSNVLGVIGGVIWFVYGEGNTLIRSEEKVCVRLSCKTRADKGILPDLNRAWENTLVSA